MPLVPPLVFEELQRRDRDLRRSALKKGSTHVSVLRPAKRVKSAVANRASALSRLHSAMVTLECLSQGPLLLLAQVLVTAMLSVLSVALVMIVPLMSPNVLRCQA